MPPMDDLPGGDAPRSGDLESSGPPASSGVESIVDFAESLASLQGAPEPSGYMPQLAGTAFAGPDRIAAAPAVGGSLPMGMTVPAVQLAHALQLLRERRAGPPSQAPGRRGFAPRRTGDGPCDGGPSDTGHSDARDEAIEAAARLVSDALAAVTGAAGLSVPMWTLAVAPRPEVADPELESVFVEFDTALAAWRALPPAAETWRPRAEVDRYLAAEEAVLNLADARPEVLRRQARLLLDLADEFADQAGLSAANAIANVAQGLLDRTER